MKDSCEIFRGRYPRTSLNGTTPPTGLEDMSRGNNDGVFQNTPTWVQEKSGLWVINHGSALNQFITLGTIANMSMGILDQSFACWFKMTETGFVDYRYMFVSGAYTGSRAGILGLISSGTTIIVGFCDGSAPVLSKTFTLPNFFDTRYHNLVITYDRSSLVLVYLDGIVSVTAGLDISSQPGKVVNYQFFYLGCDSISMYGRMGGARVTNRVYTPDEIVRMYIAEAPLYGLKV